MDDCLLDENLPRKLARMLSHLLNMRHVAEEGLLQSTDNFIWEYAKRERLTIITKDIDFQYLSFTYDCPPKVIRLNCGNKSTRYIADLLTDFIEDIRFFMLSLDICYLEIGKR